MCVGYFHLISIVSAIEMQSEKVPNKRWRLFRRNFLKGHCFDKTGTLTKGVPVTDFNVLNKQVDENEMLSIITALEYRSQHPLASAIMKRAEEANIFIQMLW